MKGAQMVRLGDVAESMKNGIYKSKDAYADDGIPCLRMYNIEAGGIVWRDIKRMTLTAQELTDYGLESGDLLVNRVNSRELVGKTALITQSVGHCVFESKNIRVRLRRDLAEPAYVNYALLGFGHAHFDRNAQQVVGMASISQPQVAAFELTWRPLEQQREVVAYLDEQLSRLDASVAALHRVQANLKRYRASVLKAACEGRLVPTEADVARGESRSFETGAQLTKRILASRRTDGKLRKEPFDPETSGLSALPDGWAWTTLQHVGSIVGGLTKNPKRESLPVKLPYLRVANVYANELRLDQIEHIGVAASELDKLLLLKDDLLVVEGNGSPEQIGRVALWNGSIAPCVHQNHLIKIRLHGVDPRWVLYWLLSPQGRTQIERVTSSTSGLHTLSTGKVSALRIPLPPLAEQHRIVAEADRRLSLIRTAEAQVAANLVRAQRLRQSILQAAFSSPGSGDRQRLQDAKSNVHSDITHITEKC